MTDELEACAAAWKAADSKLRDASARKLGIELGAKAATTLSTALDKANGRRRTLLLSHADLLRVMLEAMACPHGIAVRHGGTELNYKTSLCLAVKHGRGVTVAVGQCWGDRPTPGRVWSELGPWQQDFARNVDKAQAWAKQKAADRVQVPIDAKAKPRPRAGRSGDKLLAQVLAHPEDDAPRLVYSDYLIEQGDPRGELIAVQCAIATTPPRKRAPLVKRERELLRKHRRTWTKNAEQVALGCELRRGFVASVTATAAAFATKGATLFEHDPIEELLLAKPTGGGLEQLAAAAHVGRLRALLFWDPFWLSTPAHLAKLRTFLRSAPLRRVRELRLRMSCGPIAGLEDMFADLTLPALERLELSVVGARTAFAKLATAKLPALRALVVPLKKGPELDRLRKAFPKAKFE